MKCECGGKTRVMESGRDFAPGRRVRKCMECEIRFATFETREGSEAARMRDEMLDELVRIEKRLIEQISFIFDTLKRRYEQRKEGE